MASPDTRPAPNYGHDLEAYKEAFNEFVNGFLSDDPQGRAHIELKRDHSLRVLDNARLILERIAPSREVGDMTLLSALFHDVGRFPQYRRYRTFHDRLSENHAVLGVKTLRQLGLLRGLPLERRKVVQAAVALHNRRFIPRGVGRDLRACVQVVRDADKLDIMKVMLEHFAPEQGKDPVVTLHVKDDPERYTPELYDQVMRGEMGDYSKMKWVNDFKLLLCGWVFHFNYPASRVLLAERKTLEGILDGLPKTREMRGLAQRVMSELA